MVEDDPSAVVSEVYIPMESIMSVIPAPPLAPSVIAFAVVPSSDAHRQPAWSQQNVDGGEYASTANEDNGAVAPTLCDKSPTRLPIHSHHVLFSPHAAVGDSAPAISKPNPNRSPSTLNKEVSSRVFQSPRRRSGSEVPRPLPENDEFLTRVRVIESESRELKGRYNEARRQRRSEQRSFDFYTQKNQDRLDALEEQMEKTRVIAEERAMIQELYLSPVRAPQLKLSPKKSRSKRSTSSCEQDAEKAVIDEVFETRSSVMRMDEGPRLPPIPHLPHSPPRHEDVAKSLNSPSTIDKLPLIHKATQDIIKASERRYYLEVEKEQQRLQQEAAAEARKERQREEQLIAARHVLHERMAEERRRETARRNAQLQNELKIEAIKARIAEKQMKLRYHKWRQGVHPIDAVGGMGHEFGKIVKANEVQLAL